MKNDGFFVTVVAITLIIIVTILAGCPKPGPTPPVTPPDASDAAPPATCAEGIAHLNALGCRGAAAFAEQCPRVLDPAFRSCVARAPTCAAAGACD